MTATLVRHPYVADDAQAKSFIGLCRMLVRGLTPSDDEQWLKFLRKLLDLELGELMKLNFTIPRNPRFHRKFFAMLDVGFDAWNPEVGRVRRFWKGQAIAKNLDQFRHDVIILAGFYDASYALDGTLRLTAKSMSFAKMDDLQFEKLYSAVADVLLEKVLTKYTRDDLDEVVEKILGFT